MTLLTEAELARARALYRDGWRRASAYEQLLRRKMVK